MSLSRTLRAGALSLVLMLAGVGQALAQYGPPITGLGDDGARHSVATNNRGQVKVVCISGCSGGGGGGSAAAFNVTGNTSLAVTTSSARVALPSADTTVLIRNPGAVSVFVRFGGSSVTAATTDFEIPAGWAFAFNADVNTYVAAITGSGSATLSVSTGTGIPALVASSSGGGGGSTNLTGVNGVAPSVGTGTQDSGTIRVVLATDQAQPTNAFKSSQSGTWTVQPGNTANTTPWLITGSGTAGTPATGVVTVQGATSMTALKVDGSAVTQPVSAASLPLPTGAATSAKQAAPGTAGTPSTDVLTVQGATSMTALKVDGSGVTQPVSGTVTASNTAGTAADNAAVSGNPVSVACIYESTLTTYVAGNNARCHTGTKGSMHVELWGSDSTTKVNVTATMTDGFTATANGLSVIAYPLVFNGSTYDRTRVVANATDSSGTGIQAAGILAQLDDTSPNTVTENQFGNLRMSPNRALLTKPFASDAETWSYAAAASGIVNTTTAVTMKAAAGAGLRIYTTACQVSADALGAATEVAIRDGAAGTVLWRVKIGTGGLSLTNIDFPVPLRGTANTLEEVVTLTATTTGGVYVNCQGYAAP
ncbi:MAG: hypothetical protein ACXWKX_03285 [Caulobacteraceae bacterium]